MAKSRETFQKRMKEKKRMDRKQEKRDKKEQRKAENAGAENTLETMIAFIDENGNLTETPPEEIKGSLKKAGILIPETTDVSGNG